MIVLKLIYCLSGLEFGWPFEYFVFLVLVVVIVSRSMSCASSFDGDVGGLK